jgi:hypothetical protein
MSITELLTRARDLAASLVPQRADAVAQLASALRALSAERAALAAARDREITRWPPRADIAANIVREVERIGAAWRAQHGDAIVTSLAGRVDCSPRGEIRIVGARLGVDDPFAPLNGTLNAATLCGLVPHVIVAGLQRLVSEQKWDEGVSLAERPPRIAEIDAAMAALDAEWARLTDVAREAGITLPMTGGRA